MKETKVQATKHLICTKPFEWFEATEMTLGFPVYLCCSAWLNKPAGNLLRESPKEIWHSKASKDIRRSVIDGSFKYCNGELCPHINAISGPVKYVDEEEYNNYVQMIEEESSVPKYLNCGYDRSCNLSCPTCRVEVIMAKGDIREKIARVGKSIIYELGSGLDNIYITGTGDPFASKHFLDLLTSGILQEFPNLRLHLHTNAQLLTPEVWNKFKLASNELKVLEVSIDGATKETYEENRRPGKWDVLLKNMEFISQLKKAGHIQEFKISMVVQENNYQEMPAFVEMGNQWGVDHIYFSTINNWGTFSKPEFIARAVHKDTHPHFPDLVEVVNALDTNNSRIELGYFKNLLNYQVRTDVFSLLSRKIKSLLNET